MKNRSAYPLSELDDLDIVNLPRPSEFPLIGKFFGKKEVFDRFSSLCCLCSSVLLRSSG